MIDNIQKSRIPSLIPDSQFPGDAIAASTQVFPKNAYMVPGGGQMLFTWEIASVADSITPWGRNVALRDRQLRDFWPTEPYLAGAVTSVSFRNAAYDWEIRGPSESIETAVTDMLKAAIAGDSFGWSSFVKKFSLDMSSQDNGAFIELIRDPGMDAGSPFKNEKAPVLGVGHLDANQCVRTGDPEYPVVYYDRNSIGHKLAWYQVIPFSDFPSSIEKMNGVGYCAVTRALRLSQIMRSVFLFKDEKISGRHYKQIHFVSGVSKQDLKDEIKRGQEDADNKGQLRYIEPAILASLDPEKRVSVATIDLASLPNGFDFDKEMKWYISGLALDFGVDYQEFAPLPGGNLGSSEQSMILQRKSSGKGPAMFMKLAEALKNYGVLPRGCEMIFEDRDEEKELDKQTLRKLFQEEMALAIRNGYIDPDTARAIGISRGLYSEKELRTVPKGYGWELTATTIRENLTGNIVGNPEIANPGAGDTGAPGAKQPIGKTGGNTIAEDAARTKVGVPNNTGGNRLMKFLRGGK